MTAIPTEAATVMLLRPCPEPGVKDIEALLVLRHRKSSFVPGYHVFPGGVIDPDDYASGVERFIAEIGRQHAARIFADMSHPEKALGAFVAGIRETFEEVGILIARKKDGSPLTIRTGKECKRFADYRRALIQGQIKFSQILETEDIVLPGDSLSYFSHWITPEALPLRYDVRFFAAEVPDNQIAVCDGVELTDLKWLRPRMALADYEAGKIEMVLPQIMTLKELSCFQTVQEVLASAGKRKISANLTKIKVVDGRNVEIMPDGTGYDIRPPVY